MTSKPTTTTSKTPKTLTMGKGFVIEKVWDETRRRDALGRLHASRGRWQWVVRVNGEADSGYDTKRAATHRVYQLLRESRHQKRTPSAPAPAAAGVTRPDICTSCQRHVSLSGDWTLWPWPDGAWLCERCNDARHEVDDWTEVERAAKGGGQ